MVESFTELLFEFEVRRLRVLDPPSVVPFSVEELHLIDFWTDQIASKHTAASISRLSHDYGWEIAASGEELPAFAFLAARLREPRAGDEIDWREQAERLGIR